jgi:DNA-binding CsgD family transcriptional regulator
VATEEIFREWLILIVLDYIFRTLGLGRNARPPLVDDPELLLLLAQLVAEEGRGLDEVVEELLYEAIAERHAAVENFEPWQELTPREKQAAALACLGYTNLEIAERMVISSNTVKTHLRHVLRKFSVNSKSQLREVLTGWDFRGWIDGQDLLPDAGAFGVSTLSSPYGVSR